MRTLKLSLVFLIAVTTRSVAQITIQSVEKQIESAYDSIYTNLEAAEKLAILGLSNAENIQSQFWAARANNYLGIINREKGNFDEALVYLKKAETIRINLKLETDVANVWVNMASVYREKGEYSTSLEFLNRAKSTYLFYDSTGLMNCYLEIANTYENEGSLALSKHAAHMSLDLAKRLRKTKGEAKANYQLAINHLYDGNIDSALIYCQTALSQFIEINDPTRMARCQGVLADIYMQQGFFQKSEKLYQDIFSRMNQNEIDDPSFIFSQYNNYANLLNNLDRPAAALDYLRKAENAMAKENISIADQMLLSINKGTAFLKLKNADSTYHYLLLGIVLNDSLKSDKRIQAVAKIQTQYKTKEAYERIAQLSLDYSALNIQYGRLELALVCGAFLIIGLVGYFLNKNQRNRIVAEYKEKYHLQKIDDLVKSNQLQSKLAHMEGKEAERTRIAMQMHDSIGNSLMALKIRLEILERTTQERAKENQAIKTSLSILEDAYEDIRQLSHELKRAGLISLLQSLSSLSEKIAAPENLKFKVIDLGVDETIIEEQNKEEILGIAKELLGNTLRYARATDAALEIKTTDSQLIMTYFDNGVVKQSYDSDKSGIGIQNIYDRVSAMNGKFFPNLEKGEPFTASFIIPINQN